MQTKKIFTLPNILSMLRICMIPFFVRLYVVSRNHIGTALILLLSGLTDTADGFIARKYNMVSDLGKIIDPIADKLTQLAMLICLLLRFKLMLVPLTLLAVKELASGIMSLVVIRKTGNVNGADWHGKVNTCLLYGMMLVHVLWANIPQSVSALLIFGCTAMMLLSFIMYMLRHIKDLKSDKKTA